MDFVTLYDTIDFRDVSRLHKGANGIYDAGQFFSRSGFNVHINPGNGQDRADMIISRGKLAYWVEVKHASTETNGKWQAHLKNVTWDLIDLLFISTVSFEMFLFPVEAPILISLRKPGQKQCLTYTETWERYRILRLKDSFRWLYREKNLFSSL